MLDRSKRGLSGLSLDSVDFDRRERLAVPLLAAVAFASLILENENLASLVLHHDVASNRNLIERRREFGLLHALGYPRGRLLRGAVAEHTATAC